MVDVQIFMASDLPYYISEGSPIYQYVSLHRGYGIFNACLKKKLNSKKDVHVSEREREREREILFRRLARILTITVRAILKNVLTSRIAGK